LCRILDKFARRAKPNRVISDPDKWSSTILSQNAKRHRHLFSKCTYKIFIEASIQSNRIWLLKSVNDNLKSQPNKMWKIFSSPRKRIPPRIQLESVVTFSLSCGAVDASAKHFKSVENDPCLGTFCIFSLNLYLQLQFF